MANDYFKDRVGYEDLFIDSAGTNQSFPRKTSTGGSQNVRGMNASLTPLLLATRTLSLYDQGQLSATEVDTAIAQVCASLASIHKFQNESILDNIMSSGSGAVMSDAERNKLNSIKSTGSGDIITDSERNKLTEIVGLTQDQIDAITDISNILPIGSIIGYPINTPPTGFLECDGSEISRATYSNLFAIIGTNYGVGDGTTTFNIPDFRGEFLRGWNHGASNDPDAGSRTDRGDGTLGDNVGTKQEGEFKSHTHQFDNSNNGSGSSFLPDIDNTGNNTPSVLSTKATGGSETRPRNVNVMWCIRYSI
jgi:microcystin-dependent protein